MHSTRRLVLGAALATLAPTAALAQAITGSASARRVGGAPKMIKGNPSKLDFGGGLVVPMDSTIFGVLWEGRDRWITYGRAASTNKIKAMANARIAADGTMQLMLLTLAFEPARLEKIEGSGWRSRSRRADDLVRGAIKLPGKPLMPTVDFFGADGSAPTFGEVGDFDASSGSITHALTGFMVMKKEVDLDYVRAHAQLIEPVQAAR